MSARIHRVAVLGLLLTTLLSTSVFAEKKVLTACGHHDYPPFNWRQGDTTVGVGPDAVRLIFAQLGVEVKSVYVGPWKRCLNAVRHGLVDVVVAAYVTEERKGYAQFTATPLSEDRKSVFVWKGREFPFNSWQDLAGKRAGVQLGVSYGQQFDDFLAQHVDVVEVAERYQYFKMLQSKRIDFIPTGAHIGVIHAHREGFGEQVVALDNPIRSGFLHIGISKRSAFVSLLPRVDHELKQLRDSGEIERLTKQHLEQYLAALKKP
ncbi:MAG: transporter substrate-binding domain-containing protein [Halopseudomonas sp.]